MSDVFAQAYQKLNPAQKRAVDLIEGPVMVVAGPGTGKTQILTLRIANILRKTDSPPDAILALTFTESAVVSMRRRLAELIGSPAYAVTIATFHSFCNDIIQSYPEHFPRIIGATNISEVDQIELLAQAVRDLELEALKPFGDPAFYVRAILSAINKLKQEGIDPERFTDLVRREREAFDALEDKFHTKGRYTGRMKGDAQRFLKRLIKSEELVKVYAWYEEALTHERLYDYADMIGEVVRALRNDPDLLLMLQEQYLYMLVDEHQDTNNAQNALLELLASFHEQPNLFVVGDTKQAIFRFQGASLENFNYFKTRYPSAELVVLTSNYRSGQAVLDAADALLPGEEPLVAQSGAGLHPAQQGTGRHAAQIEVAAYSGSDSETYGVAKEVAAMLERGTSPNEIAILYRDNRDAFPVAAMLERLGVPFQIESDQDVLADPEIRKLIVLLRAIAEFGDEEGFARALHIDFLEIPPLDISLLLAGANRKRVSLLALAKSPAALGELGLDDPDALHAAYRRIAAWSKAAKNLALLPLLEVVIRESGYLSHVLAQDDPAEQLDRLQGFFREASGLVERSRAPAGTLRSRASDGARGHRNTTLDDFLDYLTTLETHGILVRASRVSTLAKRVRLMTAHRSKGLEFENVIVIRAFDGHWGNKRRRDLLPLPTAVYALADANPEEGSALDDERRLFYVALTRAKERVFITYAREGEGGREQLPSVFLEEIGRELVQHRDVSEGERDFGEQRDILFAPRIRSGADVRDPAFIRELFLKNGLSVTALNNFLQCPWKYFYRNLLRVPEAPSAHQMYGIAVHAALKVFSDAFTDTTRADDPDAAFLLAHFEHELNQQPLSEEAFTRALERGKAALTGYADRYAADWHRATVNEFTIRGILLDEDIRLTGKLDKVELHDGGVVTVVDYKTGRRKSRNEIEGNTKASRGDIKRQLVFYRLLLDRYDPPSPQASARQGSGKYRMRDGVIDFVEPDVHGNYRRESFIVTDEEVKELEAVVRDVAKQILAASFFDQRCGETDCKYCELRDFLG